MKMKRVSLFFASMAMALASAFASVMLRVVDIVASEHTLAKAEAEIAHNKAIKVTDSKAPKSIGSGSGDSPLSFVQMLTAINGRSNTSFA